MWGANRTDAARERQVRRVLGTEALLNAGVAGTKAAVGMATGSSAILGDAVHSLADLANNGVALVASRLASAPPDREHPYGHGKFETLAVFGLATLLAVLAVEVGLGALRGEPRTLGTEPWCLALMLGVLGVNIAVAGWEQHWARRLDSELLRADARHTLADVCITIAVVGSWQLAAAGYAWLDPLATLAVAGLILMLAWDLFRRAIPILVDQSPVDTKALGLAVGRVPGVRSARRVRARGTAPETRVDVVVSVDGRLSTDASHAIADRIESVLSEQFAVDDVAVHVEPEPAPHWEPTQKETP